MRGQGIGRVHGGGLRPLQASLWGRSQAAGAPEGAGLGGSACPAAHWPALVLLDGHGALWRLLWLGYSSSAQNTRPTENTAEESVHSALVGLRVRHLQI